MLKSSTIKPVIPSVTDDFYQNNYPIDLTTEIGQKVFYLKYIDNITLAYQTIIKSELCIVKDPIICTSVEWNNIKKSIDLINSKNQLVYLISIAVIFNRHSLLSLIIDDIDVKETIDQLTTNDFSKDMKIKINSTYLYYNFLESVVKENLIIGSINQFLNKYIDHDHVPLIYLKADDVDACFTWWRNFHKKSNYNILIWKLLLDKTNICTLFINDKKLTFDPLKLDRNNTLSYDDYNKMIYDYNNKTNGELLKSIKNLPANILLNYLYWTNDPDYVKSYLTEILQEEKTITKWIDEVRTYMRFHLYKYNLSCSKLNEINNQIIYVIGQNLTEYKQPSLLNICSKSVLCLDPLSPDSLELKKNNLAWVEIFNKEIFRRYSEEITVMEHHNLIS